MSSSDDLTDVDIDMSHFGTSIDIHAWVEAVVDVVVCPVTREAFEKAMKSLQVKLLADFKGQIKELSDWFVKLAVLKGRVVPEQVVEILQTIMKVAERQADDVKVSPKMCLDCNSFLAHAASQELKMQMESNTQLLNDLAHKYQGDIEVRARICTRRLCLIALQAAFTAIDTLRNNARNVRSWNYRPSG
jgi:uncharacterized protein YsxB (DUF464 family)